jgi:hypothetical protein
VNYTDAHLHDLLVRQGHTPGFKRPAKRKRAPGPSETQIQIQVIQWWDATCHVWNLPKDALFHIPNQGHRDPRTGAILRRMGLRDGVCDLFLAVPVITKRMVTRPGLFIEMKRPEQETSDAQDTFIDGTQRRGYPVRVCYSVQQVVELVTKYLALEDCL